MIPCIFSRMRCVVTGGAGFIGSHLSEALLAEGHEVLVIDDLSSGKGSNVPQGADFEKADVRQDISRYLAGVDALFHLAADPDVKDSAKAPSRSFDINVRGTFSVLEACRKADVERFLLASTSTVYGDASKIPTPEDHHCIPISNYGASKLSGEAYLSSFSASYGIKGTSMRLANVYGERSEHGVMYDFFNKLKADPSKLEVLGDGRQDKSYIHISDTVSAFMAAWKGQERQYDVFNVGAKDKADVTSIAKMVAKAMTLNPELHYTGTERGWVGDVRLMLLDTRRIEGLGWKQAVPLHEGVGRYVRSLQGSKDL